MNYLFYYFALIFSYSHTKEETTPWMKLLSKDSSGRTNVNISNGYLVASRAKCT